MKKLAQEFYCRAKRTDCDKWVEGKFMPNPDTDGKYRLRAVPVGPVYEIDLNTVEYLYEIPENPPAMAEKEVRLIDANALVQAFWDDIANGNQLDYGDTEELINNAPTIEAYTEQDVRDAYNDGYSTGMERGREKAVVHGQWISVVDRVPETIPCIAGTEYSEAVIVWTSGKKAMVAVWNGTRFLCAADYWEAWGEEITHWMPLPELPNCGVKMDGE